MPQQSSIRVTDHALVRWLEKAGLIDVEALRVTIENALGRACLAGATIGVSNYLIVAHGLIYVVRDGKVTSVVTDDGRRAHVRAHMVDFQMPIDADTQPEAQD